MTQRRTDFENLPDNRSICFYWWDGGHDAFDGAVCAMNFGVKETKWLTPPSHWAVIEPPRWPGRARGEQAPNAKEE